MSEAELLSALIGIVDDAPWIRRHGGKPLPTREPLSADRPRRSTPRTPTTKPASLYYDDGSMQPRFVQLSFDTYVRQDPSRPPLRKDRHGDVRPIWSSWWPASPTRSSH